MIIALLIVIIAALLWPYETRFLIALPFVATWWLITAPFRLVMWVHSKVDLANPLMFFGLMFGAGYVASVLMQG